MEKLLEHDIFKLKQLKRWLGENTILATHMWPNGNYMLRGMCFMSSLFWFYIKELHSTVVIPETFI